MPRNELSLTIRNNQAAILRIEAQNAAGSLIPIESLTLEEFEGDPGVGTIVEIEPAADGARRCAVTTTGAVGTVTFRAEGDTDLGPGFEGIEAFLILTVTESGEATLRFVVESVSDRV